MGNRQRISGAHRHLPSQVFMVAVEIGECNEGRLCWLVVYAAWNAWKWNSVQCWAFEPQSLSTLMLKERSSTSDWCTVAIVPFLEWAVYLCTHDQVHNTNRTHNSFTEFICWGSDRKYFRCA